VAISPYSSKKQMARVFHGVFHEYREYLGESRAGKSSPAGRLVRENHPTAGYPCPGLWPRRTPSVRIVSLTTLLPSKHQGFGREHKEHWEANSIAEPPDSNGRFRGAAASSGSCASSHFWEQPCSLGAESYGDSAGCGRVGSQPCYSH
jgi:hypothetical protein